MRFSAEHRPAQLAATFSAPMAGSRLLFYASFDGSAHVSMNTPLIPDSSVVRRIYGRISRSRRIVCGPSECIDSGKQMINRSLLTFISFHRVIYVYNNLLENPWKSTDGTYSVGL